MGCKAHALLAAGDHDISIAGRDLLRAKRDGAKARAAHLVHAEGRRIHGNASGDGGLPRRVLALACRQHLAHDHFVDVRRLNMSPGKRRPNGNLAKRVGR